MPRTSPHLIVLSDQGRDELEARARRDTPSYARVVRAKIVLVTAEGQRNDQRAIGRVGGHVSHKSDRGCAALMPAG